MKPRHKVIDKKLLTQKPSKYQLLASLKPTASWELVLCKVLCQANATGRLKQCQASTRPCFHEDPLSLPSQLVTCFRAAPPSCFTTQTSLERKKSSPLPPSFHLSCFHCHVLFPVLSPLLQSANSLLQTLFFIPTGWLLAMLGHPFWKTLSHFRGP